MLPITENFVQHDICRKQAPRLFAPISDTMASEQLLYLDALELFRKSAFDKIAMRYLYKKAAASFSPIPYIPPSLTKNLPAQILRQALLRPRVSPRL